jgi:hypothetical protein
VPPGARVSPQVASRLAEGAAVAVVVTVAVVAVGLLLIGSEQPRHDQGGVERDRLIVLTQPFPLILLP